MTDPQEYLRNLISTREATVKEIEALKAQARTRVEFLIRLEGAIEALGEVGIELEKDQNGSSD